MVRKEHFLYLQNAIVKSRKSHYNDYADMTKRNHCLTASFILLGKMLTTGNNSTCKADVLSMKRLNAGISWKQSVCGAWAVFLFKDITNYSTANFCITFSELFLSFVLFNCNKSYFHFDTFVVLVSSTMLWYSNIQITEL